MAGEAGLQVGIDCDGGRRDPVLPANESRMRHAVQQGTLRHVRDEELPQPGDELALRWGVKSGRKSSVAYELASFESGQRRPFVDWVVGFNRPIYSPNLSGWS